MQGTFKFDISCINPSCYCEFEVRKIFISLRTVKFEGQYLCNNAINTANIPARNLRLILQHRLFSWRKKNNNRLQTCSLVCNFIIFAIYAFWLAYSQTVNQCADWSRTKLFLLLSAEVNGKYLDVHNYQGAIFWHPQQTKQNPDLKL